MTIFCTPDCPYFPDMSVKEEDWIYDEEKKYKVRKVSKTFKCLYDGEEIHWTRPCKWGKRQRERKTEKTNKSS